MNNLSSTGFDAARPRTVAAALAVAALASPAFAQSHGVEIAVVCDPAKVGEPLPCTGSVGYLDDWKRRSVLSELIRLEIFCR